MTSHEHVAAVPLVAVGGSAGSLAPLIELIARARNAFAVVVHQEFEGLRF